MRKSFSQDEISFIKANRLQLSCGQLAERFKCSKTKVQRFIKKNNLQPSKEIIEQFRIQAMTGRTTCTEAEDRIIKTCYLKMPLKQLAVKIKRSGTLVRLRLRQLGLIIPPEIIEERKLIGRMKPGNVPKTKGRKWSEFMSKNGQRNSLKTTFKKGNLPPNTKADGVISIRTDKRGIQYKFIRLSKSRWIPLHRYNWIKVNGPIKRGMKLVFKDSNTMNCDIENLELLSPGQLMKRNSYHTNYPKPVAELIQLRGALNRKINSLSKKVI
jgi:hypothetical protein